MDTKSAALIAKLWMLSKTEIDARIAIRGKRAWSSRHGCCSSVEAPEHRWALARVRVPKGVPPPVATLLLVSGDGAGG